MIEGKDRETEEVEQCLFTWRESLNWNDADAIVMLVLIQHFNGKWLLIYQI